MKAILFILLLLTSYLCFSQTDGKRIRDILTKEQAQKKAAVLRVPNWDSTNNAERQNFENEIRQKFGNKKAAKIINGEVEIGFTEEMVEYSLGSPDKYIYTKTKIGQNVSWVYKKPAKRILVFNNKKLISITY